MAREEVAQLPSPWTTVISYPSSLNTPPCYPQHSTPLPSVLHPVTLSTPPLYPQHSTLLPSALHPATLSTPPRYPQHSTSCTAKETHFLLSTTKRSHYVTLIIDTTINLSHHQLPLFFFHTKLLAVKNYLMICNLHI